MHPHKTASTKADGARIARATKGETKSLIKKAVHQHDAQLHPTKHTTLKLKSGGKVEGAKPKHTMHRGKHKAKGGLVEDHDKGDSGDLPGAAAEKLAEKDRYGTGDFMWRADGGRTMGMSHKGGGKKGGGSKGHHTTVNVISSPPQNRPIPIPVPGGPPGMGAAPRPPMAPPPGGPGGPMPPGGPAMGGGAPMMPPRPAMPMGGAPNPMIRKDGGRISINASAHGGLGRLEKTKQATIAGEDHDGSLGDSEDKPAVSANRSKKGS